MSAFLPIAITLGDPAGIGPEIIAKAFRDAPEALRGCFVAGDVATLRRAASTSWRDFSSSDSVSLMRFCTAPPLNSVQFSCTPTLPAVLVPALRL